jgi:hypothetical protein
MTGGSTAKKSAKGSMKKKKNNAEDPSTCVYKKGRYVMQQFQSMAADTYGG